MFGLEADLDIFDDDVMADMIEIELSGEKLGSNELESKLVKALGIER